MESILAIDAGGTKCSAMLTDVEGKVLNWGTCAPPGMSGRSLLPLVAAARHALRDHRPRRLHIAFSTCVLPGALTDSLSDVAISVQSVGEDQAALRLADHEFGIVALAGTGAFAHFATPDGKQLRLDGRGPLMGDFGSAFYIGQKALRASVRSHFHPRHATSLADAVLAALGHAKLSEIAGFNTSPGDRSTIASLAAVVDAQASDGDDISLRIMGEAANALAETIHDGVDRLELSDTELPLIGAGSVITKSSLYWGKLCGAVKGFAPQLRPELLHEPQVVGVALQALRALYPQNYRQLRDNLLASLAQMPALEPNVELDEHIPNPTKKRSV